MTDRRPVVIPAGAWPRRMGADLAAGYVRETPREGLLKRAEIKTLRRVLQQERKERAKASKAHQPAARARRPRTAPRTLTGARLFTLTHDPFPARTKTSLLNTAFDDPSLERICNHSSDNSPKMLVSISGSSRASPVEGDANRRGSEASVAVVTAGRA